MRPRRTPEGIFLVSSPWLTIQPIHSMPSSDSLCDARPTPLYWFSSGACMALMNLTSLRSLIASPVLLIDKAIVLKEAPNVCARTATKHERCLLLSSSHQYYAILDSAFVNTGREAQRLCYNLRQALNIPHQPIPTNTVSYRWHEE